MHVVQWYSVFSLMDMYTIASDLYRFVSTLLRSPQKKKSVLASFVRLCVASFVAATITFRCGLSVFGLARFDGWCCCCLLLLLLSVVVKVIKAMNRLLPRTHSLTCCCCCCPCFMRNVAVSFQLDSAVRKLDHFASRQTARHLDRQISAQRKFVYVCVHFVYNE